MYFCVLTSLTPQVDRLHLDSTYFGNETAMTSRDDALETLLAKVVESHSQNMRILLALDSIGKEEVRGTAVMLPLLNSASFLSLSIHFLVLLSTPHV